MVTKAQPEDAIAEMTIEQLAGDQTPVAASRPPDLTPVIVRAVVADLLDVEAHGGHLGIAQAHSVTRRQVAQIDRARLARIAELTAVAEPEPVEIEQLKWPS